MLSIDSGAATPVNVVNLSIRSSFPIIRACVRHLQASAGSNVFPRANANRLSVEEFVAASLTKPRLLGQRPPNL
jgi:hypothetical protein